MPLFPSFAPGLLCSFRSTSVKKIFLNRTNCLGMCSVYLRTLYGLDEITPRPENSKLPMIHTIIRWLYSQLFEDIIVRRLNKQSTRRPAYIAILDIFGFEALKSNSFEQLLINLANEKLQHFSVHHLIIAEQQKYNDQKIHWKPIPVHTGIDVVRCLTGTSPTFNPVPSKKCSMLPVEECPAVLPYLDDVGRLAASDLTQDVKSHDLLFWRKLKSVEQTHRKSFSCLPNNNQKGMRFLVRHFAGQLTYNIDGWIQKDNDRIDPEVYRCLSTSSNSLVRFIAQLAYPHSQTIGRFKPLARRFVSELDKLLLDLSSTGLSFIRCFLPNEHQKEKQFCGCYVLQQLQQSGILEMVRISQLGYAYHQEYEKTYNQFLSLIRLTTLLSYPDITPYKLLLHKKILTEVALLLFVPHERENWDIGVTMLFCRAPISGCLSQLMLLSIHSAAHARETLTKFGWKQPSLNDFVTVYRRFALRPWRRIIRPLVFFYNLLLLARFRWIDRALKRSVYRHCLTKWKNIVATIDSKASACIVKKTNRPLQQLKYISPWFFTWKHQILCIPFTQSVLFFDGANLWLVSIQNGNRADRIYFYLSLNPKNNTQQLFGPTTKHVAFRVHANSPTESMVMGVCQHKENGKLFAIMSHDWCLLLFELQPHDISKTGRSSVHNLSTTVSTVTEARRHIDMRVTLLKLFAHHHVVDISSLRFQNVFFPYYNSQTVLATVWAFRRKSSRHGIENQVLIILVNLLGNGSVKGFFYGQLPSLHCVHKSVQSVGPYRWSVPFPCYSDVSIRPSYFAILQSSVCIALPSNRGFIWAGAGFFKLFGFSDMLENTQQTTNIQLLWDSEAQHPGDNSTSDTLRVNNTHNGSWNHWIFTGTPLPHRIDRLGHERFIQHEGKMVSNAILNLQQYYSSPFDVEKVLFTTLQGDMLVITLSQPDTSLFLEKCIRITAHQPTAGFLSACNLPCEANRVEVICVTTTSVIERIRFHDNSSLEIHNVSPLNMNSMDDDDNDARNHFKRVDFTAQTKLTCSKCFFNGREFYVTAADLLSGMLHTWSVNLFRNCRIRYLCGVPLRYPRYLQHHTLPPTTVKGLSS